MRLQARRARIWNESYLTYRYLWPNLERAVGEAVAAMPPGPRRVLDVGCGNKPYADWFQDCEYIGLNRDAVDACPDVAGDAMRLPFADATFAIVLCTQVIEHVPEPRDLLRECRRVLRPGGRLVLSAPFYWPLHEAPHDYYRYTRHGLEHLLTTCGFAGARITPDGGDWARFFLSALHAMPRWLRLPMRIPFNAAGAVLDRVNHTTTLPANYTVLAEAA